MRRRRGGARRHRRSPHRGVTGGRRRARAKAYTCVYAGRVDASANKHGWLRKSQFVHTAVHASPTFSSLFHRLNGSLNVQRRCPERPGSSRADSGVAMLAGGGGAEGVDFVQSRSKQVPLPCVSVPRKARFQSNMLYVQDTYATTAMLRSMYMCSHSLANVVADRGAT